MGYDLHITRRRSWVDAGHDITADEWINYVREAPDLDLRPDGGPYFAAWIGSVGENVGWLDWSDGQIYSKNPSPTLIDRMVVISHYFGGTVQGDDGEAYDGGSVPPRQPRLSVWTHAAAFFRRAIPAKPLDGRHSGFDLRPGDDVADMWGQHGVVVRVDPEAEHGAGLISVRYADGREDQYLMIGHPFKKVVAGGR